MKKIIKWCLIVLLFVILCKLFVLPLKTPLRYSQSIEESKWANAFICGCKIRNIKTFEPGYTFPIRSVWLEKSWELGRNRWGIVSPIIDSNPKYNCIMFDMFTENSFFSEENYGRWGIIDSLNNAGGRSNSIIHANYRHNIGDTVIFTIYKMKNREIIFKKEARSPLFEFEVICN